jgi:hypothetical protein
MHRVRVGLTGLAFVFLLLIIAAAGMRPDRSVAPAGAGGETLAVLGVAPGSDAASIQRASAPAPAVPAQTARRPTDI